MGAFESKRWYELPQETPQKVEDIIDIDDPRSPNLQINRTPIILQEYEESPQNITTRAEFEDPRSPSVKITRTPLNVSKLKTDRENDEVFIQIGPQIESKNEEGFINPAFNSSNVDSPGVPPPRTDKACLLKNTSSPGDLRRKNRLSRRQSLPQKLFSDKAAILPRSPLVQRNHSMPDEDTVMSGKNRKFTFVPRKNGLISEDCMSDKENNVEQLLL